MSAPRHRQRGHVAVTVGLSVTALLLAVALVWMLRLGERDAFLAAQRVEQERQREAREAFADARAEVEARAQDAQVRAEDAERAPAAADDRARSHVGALALREELALFRSRYPPLPEAEHEAFESSASAPRGSPLDRERAVAAGVGFVTAIARIPGVGGTWPVSFAGLRLNELEGEEAPEGSRDERRGSPLDVVSATLQPGGRWPLEGGRYELDVRFASTHAHLELPRLTIAVEPGEERALVFRPELPEDVGVLAIAPQFEAELPAGAAEADVVSVLVAERIEAPDRGGARDPVQRAVRSLRLVCPLTPGRYRIRLVTFVGGRAFTTSSRELEIVGGEVHVSAPAATPLAPLRIVPGARGGQDLRSVRIDPDGGGSQPLMVWDMPVAPEVGRAEDGAPVLFEDPVIGSTGASERLLWVPPGRVLLHVRDRTARWEQAVEARVGAVTTAHLERPGPQGD